MEKEDHKYHEDRIKEKNPYIQKHHHGHVHEKTHRNKKKKLDILKNFKSIKLIIMYIVHILK